MKHIIRAILCGSLAVISTAGTLYNGTLSGWTLGGDGSAVALTQLGVPDDAVPPSEVTLFPTLGSFVLVHNGVGGAASVATFSRSFLVGPGGGLLEFSGWFVTAEQTGIFAVSPGIDSFSVALSGDLNEILAGGDVSGAGFACFDGRVYNPDLSQDCIALASATDGAGFFQYQTKYIVNKLLGEGSYTLTFSVNDDPSDESAVFDSGFLIDDVNLNTEVVPEPAAYGLLFMGLGLLALKGRLRR